MNRNQSYSIIFDPYRGWVKSSTPTVSPLLLGFHVEQNSEFRPGLFASQQNVSYDARAENSDSRASTVLKYIGK